MSNAKNERWVVKIGSAQLTGEDGLLSPDKVENLSRQLNDIVKENIEVVLVSSGAVAAGIGKLGWDKRPAALHELQAAAAVGQMELVQLWESQFEHYQITTAQILLTHADLRDRKRYLNARSTLITLIEQSVVAIINENDTVATDEIRVGDNDNLAAMVSNLIEADLLVILTDQEGLYDSDPRTNPEAKFIERGDSTDSQLLGYAGGAGTGLSTGGMRTKVEAAKVAALSGTDTIIVNGSSENILLKIAAGETPGTLLEAPEQPLAARKQWIVSQLEPVGKLVLDDGAAKIVSEDGKSLLAVGVTRVEGDFKRGDLVNLSNTQGEIIACGLSNYNNDECVLIAGKSSNEIESLLGYINESVLIHRNNLVLS